jgi:predicted permease
LRTQGLVWKGKCMISWLLFKEIVVLFIMMGMGYLVVKLGFLQSKDSRILSVICLYLIVPCMQIEAFQIHFSMQVLRGFLLALISACVMHGLLFGGTYGLSRPLKLNQVEKGSIIYTNAGNLIVPIVTSILGRQWIIYASAFMFVQALLLWSHGKMMMQPGEKISIKKLFLNINILATLLGAFFFFSRIEIHGIPSAVLYDVSQMLGPVSMISIGMVIAGVKWSQLFANKRIFMIILMRMIVFPLIAILILKLLFAQVNIINSDKILLISLLAMAAPSGATIPQMALIYGGDADYAGMINVVTTLCCIVTMPIMIYIYQL